MTRRHQRVQRLEDQRRPAHVAAILARVRQCAPADLPACLLAEVTAVDRETCDALMDQLTDVELAALAGPEAGRLIETLSNAELGALARGDPGAWRQFQRALRAVQHQGDVCL